MQLRYFKEKNMKKKQNISTVLLGHNKKCMKVVTLQSYNSSTCAVHQSFFSPPPISIRKNAKPQLPPHQRPEKFDHQYWKPIRIWMFPKIMGFPPKSSILIGFSIINHPFWGTPIFGNTHMVVWKRELPISTYGGLLGYSWVESMFDFRGDRNMLIFRSIKDESRVFCKNKSYIRIETRSSFQATRCDSNFIFSLQTWKRHHERELGQVGLDIYRHHVCVIYPSRFKSYRWP